MFKEKVDNKELNKLVHNSNKVLRVLYLLIVILLVLVMTYILKEWKVINFILALIGVISPVFIGFILAWLLDPLVTKMEKKMPRILACIIIYLVIFAVVALAAIFGVPALSSGITDLIGSLPRLVDKLQDLVGNFFLKIGDNNFIGGYQTNILARIESMGSDIANTLPNTLIGTAKGILSGGANLLLGVMIGFYLLFDFRKFQGHVLSVMPKKWHDNAKDLMHRINGKLRNYVQGVFIVMTLVFITQCIGLSLAGLKAPILFALFCAITDVIPYIGPWIGGAPAVIVGFTISPTVGIFTLVSIIVCQLLENNFYQPLIMGKTMKLHPVTIMLGLLIFNYFFGMIGMIVATPVIASIKIIFEFINEKNNTVEKIYDLANNTKEKKSTN